MFETVSVMTKCQSIIMIIFRPLVSPPQQLLRQSCSIRTLLSRGSNKRENLQLFPLRVPHLPQKLQFVYSIRLALLLLYQLRVLKEWRAEQLAAVALRRSRLTGCKRSPLACLFYFTDVRLPTDMSGCLRFPFVMPENTFSAILCLYVSACLCLPSNFFLFVQGKKIGTKQQIFSGLQKLL